MAALSNLNYSQDLDASIVIPTYNNAEMLRACLNALLSQDFPKERFEVIVVSDGSTDHTESVVSEHKNSRLKISYFYQPNQGPAAARNMGAQKAHADIVMFTDDDCEPDSDWVSQMLKLFNAEGERIDGVKGAYRTRQQGFIARFAQAEFESRYRKMKKNKYVDFVDTYSAAFRRDVFLALGGFDTSFPVANNEDVEFSYRMASLGHKMVFNPEAVVYHRHPDTLYRYLKVKFGRAYWRMAVYRLFPDKIRSDSYTPQTLKVQILLSMFFTLGLAWWLVFEFFFFPDNSKVQDFGMLILLSCGVLFIFSSLPFVSGILSMQGIEKTFAYIVGFFDHGFFPRIHGLINRIWPSKFIKSALALTGNTIRKLIRGVFLFLSKVTGSKPVGLMKLAVRKLSIGLAFAVLAFLNLILFLIRLPWLILVQAGKGSSILWGCLTRIRMVQLSGSWLNRQATKRPVMAMLSFFLLFLRALTMGLGTLWGLQPRGTRKGRFSRLVILMAGDTLSVILACMLVYSIRHLFFPVTGAGHPGSVPFYFSMLPFVVVLFLAVFFLAGLYRPFKGLSQINEFVLLVKASFTASIVLSIMIIMLGMRYPMIDVFILLTATVCFVSVVRWVTRRFVIQDNKMNTDLTRVLIVGAGEIGRLIARKLETTSSINTRVLGFISEKTFSSGEKIDGHDLLGGLDELGKIVKDYGIHEVCVALPLWPHEKVMDLVNKESGRQGVHFHVISNLFDLISAEVDMAQQYNIPIAYLRNENMELVQFLFKRVFDLTLAAMVVMATFPFWLLIMLVIKLETKGPALFMQERVGKDGKLFRIFKFRTMYSDADKFEYSPSEAGDKRVTRVGAFLRSSSLDEFPQFLNVLKGEMSLVGPRPEMPFIVAQYSEWQRQRLRVKPGITGLWQIMGRKDLPLHESLEYDFYYIKNQSLLLDLTILVKTIPVIVMKKGAY